MFLVVILQNICIYTPHPPPARLPRRLQHPHTYLAWPCIGLCAVCNHVSVFRLLPLSGPSLPRPPCRALAPLLPTRMTDSFGPGSSLDDDMLAAEAGPDWCLPRSRCRTSVERHPLRAVSSWIALLGGRWIVCPCWARPACPGLGCIAEGGRYQHFLTVPHGWDGGVRLPEAGLVPRCAGRHAWLAKSAGRLAPCARAPFLSMRPGPCRSPCLRLTEKGKP